MGPRIFRFLLLAVAAAVIARAESGTDKRPNILWVVSEDNTFNYVGPYGDPLARTPRIDRLAKAGVTFDRAYAPCPVCAPTRSTIITGRYAAGMGTQHMRSTRPLPAGVKFFPEFLRAAGYFCTNNAKTDYNTSTPWTAAWDENDSKAHWRHRTPGQPFFAVFNFAQSHESQLHSRKPLITDPAKVRVPAYLPDTAEVRADLAQYYDNVARADAAIGAVLDELDADGLAENTIVFYYSDNGGCVSRSKRFLFDNGTHIALVARFPQKFASLAPGVPGSHNTEIINFVDLAPTVLSLVGLTLPQQFQGRAFAAPARSDAPTFTFLFRDRMDERYDMARAVTDGHYRYIRNYLPDQPWGQHQDYQWKQSSQREWESLYRAGRLNATQRAFFEPKPAEELYDDLKDPDNVHNLANDPSHLGVRDRLRGVLRNEILRLRDTGFIPEPSMIELAAGRSPTVVSTDPSRYPLAQIIDFLDATQLVAEPPPALITATQHDSSAALRYWAAVVSQRGLSLPADFPSLLQDPEAAVRVAAAEAILWRTDDPAAWRVLETAMAGQGTLERRLFALNAVARIPRPLPAEVRAQLLVFAPPGQEIALEDYLARAANPILNAR